MRHRVPVGTSDVARRKQNVTASRLPVEASADPNPQSSHTSVRCRHTVSVVCLLVLLVGPRSTSADRRTPLQMRVDVAIAKALKRLARDQRPSGAWVTQDNRESTAVTSLAVMAFMAGGHVPGEGAYGERLSRGVAWVVKQQKPNGLLVSRSSRGPMYSHGIASLMLGEVVGMLDGQLADSAQDALEKAIQVTLKAQNIRKPARFDGGWRYQLTSTDSDLSVTGWQLLALRAAKNVGCDVPAENIDRAVSYVKRCSVRGNNGFGYQVGGGPTPTRTGTGILALEVCGDHRSDEVMGSAEYLLRKPLREGQSFFYYGAYYCTVGLFKVGGKHWEQTHPRMFDMLLRMQNVDGSWPIGRHGESSAGRVYSTAMAVLALAVEYRYLPIYQR